MNKYDFMIRIQSPRHYCDANIASEEDDAFSFD